jgi:hypothetical protein
VSAREEVDSRQLTVDSRSQTRSQTRTRRRAQIQPRRVAAALLLAAPLGLLGGCGSESATPTGAAQALLRAAQSGNVAAVYALLTPRSQEELARRARTASSQAGSRRLFKPEEMLIAGFDPPPQELSAVEVVEVSGDTARLRLTSAGRKFVENLTLHRVGGTWRMEVDSR